MKILSRVRDGEPRPEGLLGRLKPLIPLALVPLALMPSGCGSGAAPVSHAVPASTAPVSSAAPEPATSQATVSTGKQSPAPTDARALAEAGTGGGASRTPPPSGSDGTLVTLERSGGLAGVQETVVIAADGEWTATSRGAKSAKGQLTAARLRTLRSLVARTSLPADVSPSAGGSCPDGFRYVISAGGRTARTDDCALESQPALSKLAAEALSAAGLQPAP